MKKQLVVATVLSLAAVPALAQGTMSPARPDPASPAAPTAPAPTAPGAGMQAPDGKAGIGHPQQQASHQWLASSVIGASVVGPDNKTIGSVSDILLEPNGSAQAAIVGVGGFLGVGEKKVALPFNQLQLARKGDGDLDRIVVTMTREDLEKAPTFTTLADQRKSTNDGMTTGSTRPAER